MRLGLFIGILLPVVTTSLTATANNLVRRDYFKSGQQKRSLVLDMTMDVVPLDRVNLRSRFSDQQAVQTRDIYLNREEAQKLQTMNFGLIPNNRDRESSQEGILVWFDDQPDAMGIMTADLVVGLNPGSDHSFLSGLPGVVSAEVSDFHPAIILVKVETPIRALELSQELQEDQDVEFAHPDFTMPKEYRNSPDKEPFFTQQWHLKNTGQTNGKKDEDINVLPAWAVTMGHPSIKIAIIDGGFDINHEDLKGAWDINTKEIQNNGKDDDGNGYKDDYIGWNLIKNSPALDGSPHGTSVAGLVAAPANGQGVVGSCPQCKLIPIVGGSRSSSDAAAFYYAKARGAHVITNSWGYAVKPTDVVSKAIRDVALNSHGGKGTVILFAMNNIDKDDCKANDLDISGLDEVFAVSGVDHKGVKVKGSAWGPCMEVVSPTKGSDSIGIITTDVTGSKGYNGGMFSFGELSNKDYTKGFSGTSAATPITAGIFGLILSIAPDMDRQTAYKMVTGSAKKIQAASAGYNAQGFSNKYGYGRVDAGAAIRLTLEYLDTTGSSVGPGLINRP